MKTEKIEWLDIENPTEAELNETAKAHGFPPTLVRDCLEPRHLPKYERVDDQRVFIIVRIVDKQAHFRAATTQRLTRKIAVFVNGKTIITAHRSVQPMLKSLATEVASRMDSAFTPQSVLVPIIDKVLDSYEPVLGEVEEHIDSFEESLLKSSSDTMALRKLHLLRRRLSVIKRLLWHTMTVIQRLSPQTNGISPEFKDLRERCDHVQFFSDELLEDVTSLLALQLSVASHRTNEVVRVLTLFSVFFMPLTFIAGVYGMNFYNIPELKWQLGYLWALAVMAAISVLIGIWFKRKGWLR
ncbi:MAG: CorA family divalent cation transporter [Bdellovibrionota bacterium]